MIGPSHNDGDPSRAGLGVSLRPPMNGLMPTRKAIVNSAMFPARATAVTGLAHMPSSVAL